MSEHNDAPDKGEFPPPSKKQKKDTNESPEQKETKTGEPTARSESEDQFNNFVNPEEAEKLKEFRVLDEVKSNDEDSNDCDESDSSDGESADLPDEEIEKMLEEDLPEGFKAAPKPKEKPYIKREKIILEEKGVNHFEVLPLDWIMIRHQSGMPVYVHRGTRVCTLSKPYFLGKGNSKRHNIPISAIPCLAYRRALEEEEKQKLIDEKVEEQIKLGTWKSNKKQADESNPAPPNNAPDQTVTMNGPIISHVSSLANKDKNGKVNDNENIVVSIREKRQCPFTHASVAKNDSGMCPVRDGRINALASVESDKSNVNDGVLSEGTENSQDYEMMDATFEEDSKVGIVNEIGLNKNDANENTVNEVLNEEDIKRESSAGCSKDNIEIPANRQPIVLPGGIVMPSPRVETVNTSWKTQHLTHEQVNDYCKKLFKFRVLNVMHFKRWADRRKYTKARKALQYPMLPEGTKLITIPVQSTSGQEATGAGKPAKRDWVMNMNGRSYLSVFHEYVLHALKKQPVYEFKQLENASSPYQATVYIGGMQYGVGHGSSKRQAKSAAARASIHILIPELRDHLEPAAEPEPDFVFFDYVSIEDPRIAEFCAATCEPTPHAILRTCLLRNFGTGDKNILVDVKKLEYQKIELTMTVGKHVATVVCKNKRTAKQRASQAILQALHPHVRSWGSLLRLYGSRSVKSCKEKKLEEQQITLLQDKARHNEPNYAVLDKLKHEMRKLRERDAALAPLGTLVLRDVRDLPSHSGSNLNNVDL